MRVIIILSLLALALAEELYSTENDDFDVEKLVKDSQGMQAFVNCFVGKSQCDAIAASFNKDFPEAVQQACAKCTPAQKHILKRFLEELKKNQPQEYDTLQSKFDPQKTLFKALEAAIANA